MRIDLENISKEFGTHVALDKLNFSIEEGSLVSLLGPSGCGKTTLLRIISGLEQQTSGKVFLDGEEITAHTQQKMGFVFQHYALFKHMTAFENVAFGLRVKPRKERLSKEEIAERVHEVLSLVQLDNQSHKYPHQLSGGQQQRIALARVLVIQPKVLLLDEPFGALDSTVRRDLRRWLRKLHEKIRVTTILVTHDQEEALEVSDKVVLLNQGKLEQYGDPREIYTNPQTPFVYEFLGLVNIFSGRLKDHHLMHFDEAVKDDNEFLYTDSLMYVRPHDIHISYEKEHDGALAGTIVRTSFVATNILLEIRLQETDTMDVCVVEANIHESEWELHKYRTGDNVFIYSTQFTLFPHKVGVHKTGKISKFGTDSKTGADSK